MADLYDPNMAPEFTEQAMEIDRQRKMAEMLRKRALARQAPEGQMMGGQYVAPHWTQRLSRISGDMLANSAERKAAEQGGAYNKRAMEAAQQWQSALPQAVAARAALPGPRAEGGSPELEAQPAQPLTTQRILQHTLAGMRIPGNEKASELYNRGALADLSREDTQAAKKEADEAKRAGDIEKTIQQHQSKLEQIKLAQANKLNPEQQIMLKKMEDQTKRDIAAGTAEARIAAAEAKAKASGANLKPVPEGVRKSMSGAEEAAQSLMEVTGSFPAAAGGLEGAWDSIAGKWSPFADKSQREVADWWSQYEGSGMKARHDLFGATLSGGEAKSWKEAGIQRGMPADQISRNLKRRTEIAVRYYNGLREKYATLGYPQVPEAYDAMPDLASQEQPPAAVPPQQRALPRATAPMTQPAPQAQPLPGGAGLPPGFTRR